MVQVIPMQRAPSMGQALGAGFSQGMGQGLNFAIQDMMQQKQVARQDARNAAINKQIAQSLPGMEGFTNEPINMEPTQFLQLAQLMSKNKSLRDLITAETGTGEGYQAQQQPQMKVRQLLSGEAPMLNYEDMPAIEEGETPIAPTKQPVSRQTSELSKPLNMRLKESNAYWDDRIRQSTPENAKALIQAKKNAQSAIRDEARVEAAQEKNVLAKEKFNIEQKEKVTDYNLKQIDPVIERIGAREQKNLALRQQLPIAKQAVESGNTAGFAQWVAAKGFAPGMTPEAALLKYLSKENIANVVDRIGGRPNMFLEKVASTASAAPGHDKETALGLIEFEESEMRQDDKEAEITRKLARKYANSKKKMFPGQFEEEVNKEVRDWIPKNVAYTAYKIQQSRESVFNDSQLKERAFDKALAPGYTPITQRRMQAIKERLGGDDAAAARKAMSLGYIPPKYTTEPK